MGALGSSVFPQEAIHYQFLGPGVSEHSRVTRLRIGQGCFSWLQAIGIGVRRHQFFDIFGSNVFGSRFHEDGRELHRLDPNSRGSWVGRTTPPGGTRKRARTSAASCAAPGYPRVV